MGRREVRVQNKETGPAGESQQNTSSAKDFLVELWKPAIALKRALAKHLPKLGPFDIRALQRSFGNTAVRGVLSQHTWQSSLQTGPEPALAASETAPQSEPLLQRRPLTADELPLRPLAAEVPASARAMMRPNDGPNAGTVPVQTVRRAASPDASQQPAGRTLVQPDGVQTQPAQGVRTVARLNGAVIQRFNLAADNPYEPTSDLGHPALANIALPKMGPYKFYPMKGAFEYQPPDINVAGVEKFLKRLVNHQVNKAWYEPEKIAAVAGGFQWVSPPGSLFAGKKITFHPGGVVPANPATRAAKAALLYSTQKSGNLVPGKVLDGLKAHNKGNSPRPFVSIVQEDLFGAAEHAHTGSRHVLGGAEAPDADAVAARAAFGMLGGLVKGAVKGAYTPVASAFKTVADANTDVGNAIKVDLTNNWNKCRIDILTKGGVDLQVPRAGGNIVAYKSTAGGAWGLGEKPTYLDPASKGQKPLFYPDPRWDTWAAGPGGLRGALAWVGALLLGGPPFSAAQSAALKATPLTEDVAVKLNNVNVRILASEDPNHQGWFIHSAYPIY